MPRYTKKDKDGRYYIEGVNGKLESNIFGHTYGEAIDRFAQLENADVVPRGEVKEIFEEFLALLIQIAYLGADGNWHLRKMKSSMVNPLIDYFCELKEKYTKGGEGE